MARWRTSRSTIRLIMAVFLITGTCVGGGMLALPVSGGRVGFIPAAAVLTVAWLFMTVTGLLYLEIAVLLDKDAHLITMAARFLGRRGQSLCWAVFLFIGYASLVAYLSEGGKIIAYALHLPARVGSLGFALLFAGCVLCGSIIVNRVNALLFGLMVTTFLLLLGLGPAGIDTTLIWRQRWDGVALASLFPLMLTTFSYPGIVPVIYRSLNGHERRVRLAILAGTTLTYLIYMAWLWVILGSVPMEGPLGLAAAYANDHSAAIILRNVSASPWVGLLGQVFGFLALSTSMLGVGWALCHFLVDGLKLSWRQGHLALVVGLVVLPSLLFLFSFEKVFFTALELSGGIGDALVSGLIPAWMLWVARYHQKRQGSYQVFGGHTTLVVVILFSFVVCCYELFHRFI